MVKITISNLNNLIIEKNDNSKTVLSFIQEDYIDWMHACGAKGRCTTCKMIVLGGMEYLTEITPAEERFAKLNKLDMQNERLACQCKVVKGAIKIKVAEENKMPHLTYND